MFSVPNVLSASRLLSVPVIVTAAALGRERLFFLALGYALASDAVDGFIARAMRQVTDAGARIDSAADCALYLTAPLAALVLFPWLRATESVTTLAIVAAYALPVAYGWLKYRRLTAYHTRAARAAGCALSIAALILFATHVAWPLRVAAALLVAAALEEIAITRALPAWRSNVSLLAAAIGGDDRRTTLGPSH